MVVGASRICALSADEAYEFTPECVPPGCPSLVLATYVTYPAYTQDVLQHEDQSHSSLLSRCIAHLF
uniref:Uncharacterized protein n=1 Tax=Megaselia scalaris TaxID=36166 RepID=T1H244_MEGSC